MCGWTMWWTRSITKLLEDLGKVPRRISSGSQAMRVTLCTPPTDVIPVMHMENDGHILYILS